MSDVVYPECEKLSAVSKERATVSDFLDWLTSKGLWICEPCPDGRFYPVRQNQDSLVLDYLEIDQVALERERRAMIKTLQKGIS